ncbi:MAG TPA: DUF6438 domain-containing protein [Polyangia bacterium]|jgi:hypothetical protein
MAYRGLFAATLFLSLASLAAVACGGANGSHAFDRGAGFVPPKPPRPLIRLARAGACPKWCPTYSVDVDVDGGVTYSGGSNVMTIGPATGRLSPEALGQLRAVMSKASQAKMPSQKCACGCATNTPYVYLTTWDKDPPRTVMYEEGCESAPHAIRVLEDAVDDLAGVERWIGTVQQRRLCFEEQRDCSALVVVPRLH